MPLIDSGNIGGGGGSVGMIIDSNINQQLSVNQTYTVPAGKYAIIRMKTSSGSCTVTVSNGGTISVGTTSWTEDFHLGPGNTIFNNGGTNALRLSGVVFANG